jgi:hypothetical protein
LNTDLDLNECGEEVAMAEEPVPIAAPKSPPSVTPAEVLGAGSQTELLRIIALQQSEILEARKPQPPKGKDPWDKFATVSTFFGSVVISVVVVALTAYYNAEQAQLERDAKFDQALQDRFANSRQASKDQAAKDRQTKLDTEFRDQQERRARSELVQKFIPHLISNDIRQQKLAVIAISRLGDTQLAADLAVLNSSAGAKAGLVSIASKGKTEADRSIAETAVSQLVPPDKSLILRKPPSQSTGGSAIGREALQVAMTQIGVRESGGRNRGPKVNEYLRYSSLEPGNEWCNAFVIWCFSRTSNPNAFKPAATSAALEEWFVKRGSLHKPSDGYVPKPGDVFIARFPRDGKLTAVHSGFVYSSDGRTFSTVEGNTNNSGSREGNGVYAKTRVLSDRYVFGTVVD